MIVRAENYVRAGQAEHRYSRRIPSIYRFIRWGGLAPLASCDLVFLRFMGVHLKLYVGEKLDSNLRAPSEWVL